MGVSRCIDGGVVNASIATLYLKDTCGQRAVNHHRVMDGCEQSPRPLLSFNLLNAKFNHPKIQKRKDSSVINLGVQTRHLQLCVHNCGSF